MAAEEIHVNDIGTVFEVTVMDGANVLDISSASSLRILLRKPGGNVVLDKAAVLSGDGTDGKMRYVSVADDLDIAGKWKIQGFVQNPAGSWHTDVDSFRVYRNIQ